MTTIPVRLTQKTIRVSHRQIEVLRALAERPRTAREINFATLRALWKKDLINRQPHAAYHAALWVINDNGRAVLDQTGGE